MSCCCSSDAPKSARRQLEFSKVCSSGFEKDRKITYYPESEIEKTACEKALSQASVAKRDSEGNEDEDENEDEVARDMVFVDGNEADIAACEDEDELMERVWWLSKPPFIPRQTPVVPARRVQVVKERLSSTVKGLPNLKEVFQDQVERSLMSRRRAAVSQYVNVGRFNQESKSSCQQEILKALPACARELSEFL